MIEISRMSKVYNTESGKIYALKNISLRVKPGELVAIVGKSGSGKSTLMNILGCLDNPTCGKYRLSGNNVANLSFDALSQVRRSTIGFVFQGFNLLPRMSALENVALPLMYSGTPAKERQARAQKALCSVGLEDRMLHKPAEMSGGQQQRVAIARALIGNPRLILADEPTGNLDPASGEDILNLLLEVNKTGRTVILITHDEKIARRVNRTVCIDHGQILSDTIQ